MTPGAFLYPNASSRVCKTEPPSAHDLVVV